MSDKDPSLLDDESRGGDTAQRGFLYQDDYVIGNMPRWLATEGFMQVKQEAMGDVETSFFVPGRGVVHHLAQVKSQVVTPSEFKDIIVQFLRLDAEGTFISYEIVSPGLAAALRPLKNELMRLKNHYPDYQDTHIGQQSLSEFEERVVGILELEAHVAQFLIEKVDICASSAYGDGAFRSGIVQHLPEFNSCTQQAVNAGLSNLRHLVHTQKHRPISRRELEDCLYQVDGSPVMPLIKIEFEQMVAVPQYPLRFAWDRYFNFQKQRYPSIPEWQDILLPELHQTAEWISSYRQMRSVRIRKHAISTALAFGSVFSAVAGFDIEIEHNGQIWSTGTRATDSTPEYDLSVERTDKPDSECLILSIGIIRDIAADVEASLIETDLEQASRLHIFGPKPIATSEQANKMIGQIKRAIVETLQQARTGVTIHLFFAGPTHIAALLGHRLNATAVVQCYEWNNITRSYLPACRLFA